MPRTHSDALQPFESLRNRYWFEMRELRLEYRWVHVWEETLAPAYGCTLSSGVVEFEPFASSQNTGLTGSDSYAPSIRAHRATAAFDDNHREIGTHDWAEEAALFIGHPPERVAPDLIDELVHVPGVATRIKDQKDATANLNAGGVAGF